MRSYRRMVHEHGPRELAHLGHPETLQRAIIVRMPTAPEVAVRIFAYRARKVTNVYTSPTLTEALAGLTKAGYQLTWTRPVPTTREKDNV